MVILTYRQYFTGKRMPFSAMNGLAFRDKVQHLLDNNKKLSYRRGTARRSVLVSLRGMTVRF